MKTFNGDKKLKAELIKDLKHHQELDTFIQGKWLIDEKVEGNVFKGCFYGCTMQTQDNPIRKFSEKYNIDLWYCYLTEKLFEGLPDGEYQKFPLQSIEVLPVDFDINKIKSKFHYELLKDQLRFCKEYKEVKKAIKQCMNLFKVDFDKIDESALSAAESAALSAARSARSAARSATESALSATLSATLSARSAALSALSATESARSATESALSATLSARSATESARSATESARSATESALSATESARSATESAALSARYAYYVWMRDLLFKIIKDEDTKTSNA